MAANAACTHEGATARLWCVTCEEPICTRCMVETRVGFKCQEHGRMGAVTAPAKPAAKGPRAPMPKGGEARATGDPPAPPPPGRRSRRGFGLLGFVILAFVLVPLLTVGLGFLFASTGNRTGFVAFLPLLAVFVVLIGGTAVVARRILR